MTADVLVVGAGPAGLSLATRLAGAGASVEIIDEQPAPGGQIYRAAERNVAVPQVAGWLGTDYAKGAPLIAEARAQRGIAWRSETSVWDIRCQENGVELGVLHGGQTSVLRARHVVLATGAMERPTPFPGWTLPGVMGIGAAQTLLKDGGLLPEDGVVVAGQGPLLYLFASQILAAGIRPRAVLDFGPRWTAPGALLPFARAAFAAPGAIAKGLRLRARISRDGIPHLFGVGHFRALGEDGLRRVRFRHRGQEQEIETSLLLVHDGVIPNTHMTAAAGCRHDWQDDQMAWAPRLDHDGRTSRAGLWVLGDGARIMGADAAVIGGRIMARVIARELGLTLHAAAPEDRADRKAVKRIAALRTFLDRQYAPARGLSDTPDDTMICRCEGVRAGDIRRLARSGCMGPNQLRAFSRAGMGPCMGRQCGTAISQLMAEETGRSAAEIGYFSIRPPVKPVTLAQLASLCATTLTETESCQHLCQPKTKGRSK